MAVTLLVPTLMADRCYLIEALMWVALQRFPLSSPPREGTWDGRVEEQNITGAAPFLPYDLTVTDEECAWVGLPKNPAYEALREGKEYEDEHLVADVLADGRLSEHYRYWNEAAAFHQQKAAWDEKFEEFLAEPKAKLRSALQQGRVVAAGKKVGSGTVSRLADLKKFRWPGLQGMSDYYPSMPPWLWIEPGFWNSAIIEWEGCWAESTHTAHCLIVIEMEELLEYFPPPQPEKVSAVVKIAGTLALVDNTPARRRGRPPFNWPDIHQEAMSYIREHGLPPKQDAFVALMIDRSSILWGKAPGRSAMATQLSRYYRK
jgi:hypothetical protein